MEIDSVFDLLTTYPRRYVDRTRRVDLSDLTVGDEVAVFGEVERVSARRTRQGRALVEVRVSDDGDSLTVVFFNQAWRERQLPIGTQALFFGKVTEYRGKRQMTNPVVDVIVGASGVERDATRVGRVVAIYPASGKAGLTSWEIGGYIEEALERAGEFYDPIPESVRRRYDLLDRTRAFYDIHLPAEMADRAPARRRLAFDELWRLQMLLVLRRHRLDELSVGVAHGANAEDLSPGLGTLADSLVARFIAGHRFELTNAQRRVLEEIFQDLAQPRPMHRLLQGDVGAGKTTVALAAILAVVAGGRQGALMAPTEVLAEQHVSAIRRDLGDLTVSDPTTLSGSRPVSVALLTGRVTKRDRDVILTGLKNGEVDVVVGTHALLTDDVAFRSLGMVVIDEQHRFGVEQRAQLRAKGRARSLEQIDPDLLVMTATPIPRTAAMAVFGDLDLSVLDELPGGRRPITTRWLAENPADAWSMVRAEVAAGRRAYVVCSLVEGSERVEAASAVEERDRLSKGELAGLRVGLLHGQMRGADKDAEMERFRRGELDVLVATVVIEVGVDVPEATVIVIEDAGRFGLAQLHQLRGRVGRSDQQSYCYLLGQPEGDAAARLQALVDSTDGFYLAEVDLELRGEGTLLGERQRGRSDLRLARLRDDEDLLLAARAAAEEMLASTEILDDDVRAELSLFVDDEEAEFLFKS